MNLKSKVDFEYYHIFSDLHTLTVYIISGKQVSGKCLLCPDCLVPINQQFFGVSKCRLRATKNICVTCLLCIVRFEI